MLSSRSSLETRLMVANGIVMSKLCYLIQLWGGSEAYLLRPLQVLQNRAARLVTGCGWFTPRRRLLQMCKWLSVKQLIFYQSVIMAHKIATLSAPFSLAAKMTTAHPRNTRQAASDLEKTYQLTTGIFRTASAIGPLFSTTASQPVSEQ